MANVIGDLQQAFGYAIESDPVITLLPLAIVAIAGGLRASGLGQALAMATRGLFWVGGLSFMMGGMMSDERFDMDSWGGRLDAAWAELMRFRFMEVMGFWLLLVAGIFLVLAVRTAIRR